MAVVWAVAMDIRPILSPNQLACRENCLTNKFSGWICHISIVEKADQFPLKKDIFLNKTLDTYIY